MKLANENNKINIKIDKVLTQISNNNFNQTNSYHRFSNQQQPLFILESQMEILLKRLHSNYLDKHIQIFVVKNSQ